jgi:glycosyl transferase, family 25
MKLDECFPHQVCINLDSRPDRWERITARFVEHGINRVIRFPAVDGKTLDIPAFWHSTPGAYGCLRSHLAVIERMREEGKTSVLIFEDDAVLAPEFSLKFAGYVKQLPDDWDMLFFGGLHGEPLTRVADNVMRVTHSLSTYAYALKHTIYDKFIEVNREALALLDQNTRALQKQFNCYCFMPHLAWVEEDFSDVTEERTNLWWLKESLVLFGPEIDEILKRTIAVISYRKRNADSLTYLAFTIDYLSRRLPPITLLVLEQGEEPSLKRSDLPADCHLEFVEDSACCNRTRLLRRGFEMFESIKDYFMFLDSDVFLTREDIIANLLKSRHYDFVSSFHEIYHLNRRDTLRILHGDVRWDYDTTYPPQKKPTLCDACCIFTRSGLRSLGDWKEASTQSDSQLSASVEELLRVYHSPNQARRLSTG